MGRGTNVRATADATLSRNQAPMKGVGPSAPNTASTRMAVVHEKSNRPSCAAGSEVKGGGLFMP